MNQESIAIHAPELPEGLVWLNVTQPLSLRALRGHLVILDFWTYCCVNCMHVLPVLRAIEARHEHEPLMVIGVHSAKFEAENHPDRVADALARYEVKHPVVVDRDMRIWEDFAIRSWPTLVVVRPDGTIAAVAPGEPDPDVLEAFVVSELDRARARGILATQPIELHSLPPPDATPLRFPGKIDVARDGRIAVADSGHHRVLVVDAEGKVLHTIGSGLAGLREGPFDEVALDDPQGVRFDAAGTCVFIADARAHVVACADLQRGTLAVIAGTGALGAGPLDTVPLPAKKVALRSPWGLALDDRRKALFVALAGCHQVAMIELGAGTISAVAGTGAESKLDAPAAEATFAQPSDLALLGDTLFVADSETSSVRAFDVGQASVRTVVGRGLFEFGDVDGAASEARLQHCLAIALDRDGAIVVADTYNHALKRVDPRTGETRTVFRDGEALTLREPGGVAWDAQRGAFLVADTGHHRLVEVRLAPPSARVLTISEAPVPRHGAAGRLAFRPPKVETDWFTAHLEAEDALATGPGLVHLRLRPTDGLHLAARSIISVALEVSRRGDLLVPAWTKARSEVPLSVADLTIPVPVRVESLPADRVDAEITACVDAVLCSEGGASEPSACIPVRTYVRIPLRLAREGRDQIEYDVPIRRG